MLGEWLLVLAIVGQEPDIQRLSRLEACVLGAQIIREQIDADPEIEGVAYCVYDDLAAEQNEAHEGIL